MHSLVKDLFYSIFPNKNKYLTYGNGNSPIILSAPHGGNIKPLSIPYRKYGNRSRDTYTRRLIQRVIELLDENPYFIYADIHRSRVDLNRDYTEATQENQKAEEIWFVWNDILSEYQTEVRNKFGKGLYIDIHSHNNSDKFQIGYGLSVRDYLDLNGGWEIKNKSTLFPLVNEIVKEKKLCFGIGSIIDSLEYQGYKVLIPESENKYLNGGRNIQQYSMSGTGAIQVECPIPILKKDLEGVAIALANSIDLFKKTFL